MTAVSGNAMLDCLHRQLMERMNPVDRTVLELSQCTRKHLQMCWLWIIRNYSKQRKEKCSIKKPTHTTVQFCFRSHLKCQTVIKIAINFLTTHTSTKMFIFPLPVLHQKTTHRSRFASILAHCISFGCRDVHTHSFTQDRGGLHGESKCEQIFIRS